MASSEEPVPGRRPSAIRLVVRLSRPWRSSHQPRMGCIIRGAVGRERDQTGAQMPGRRSISHHSEAEGIHWGNVWSVSLLEGMRPEDSCQGFPVGTDGNAPALFSVSRFLRVISALRLFCSASRLFCARMSWKSLCSSKIFGA